MFQSIYFPFSDENVSELVVNKQFEVNWILNEIGLNNPRFKKQNISFSSHSFFLYQKCPLPRQNSWGNHLTILNLVVNEACRILNFKPMAIVVCEIYLTPIVKLPKVHQN